MASDAANPLTPDDVLSGLGTDPDHRQQVAGAVRNQLDRGIDPADIPDDLANLARRMAPLWTLRQTQSAYMWWHDQMVREVLAEIEADA